MSNYFLKRNNIVLLLLGFSSGLPFTLTSSTLQTWITIENIDIKTIGFFSLVGQAYVFKFLWSPIIDYYNIPFFGKRQGWLLLSQLLLIGGIIAISFVDPRKDLNMLAILAVLISFFSASQDIVFDAWKTDILLPKERGNGAAISVLGYRIAMLVSGGFALWIADRYLGWQLTYRLMAVFMIPGVITTLISTKESKKIIFKPIHLKEAIVAPMLEFFSRNNAWLIISLIVLYKLGDAFSTSLTSSFLIRGIGFDPGKVGLINKTVGLLAVISGTIYGGFIIKRFAIFYALMIFGILQVISNFSYYMISCSEKKIYIIGCAIFIENLCGSMGTAALVALIMILCNKSFSATQFALLSAFSAIGRVYIGMISGWLVESWGWSNFYAFSVIAAIPGLILLAICKKILENSQNNDIFLKRTAYKYGYKFSFIILFFGFICIIIWLFLLLINTFVLLNFHKLLIFSFIIGAFFIVLGMIIASTLDYFAIRYHS